MKKILAILILAILSLAVYADDIRNYSLNKIKTVNIGSEEGKIGYDKKRSKMGVDPGPTYAAISQDGFLYLCDPVNYRINVYDSNINYIRTINEKEDEGIYYSYNIKFDSQNNLISLNINKDIVKTNNKGDLIFKIEQSKLCDDVIGGQEYYVYGDTLLLKDKRENGYFKYVDNKGNYLSSERINSLRAESKNSFKSNFNLSKAQDLNVLEKVDNDFIEKKNVIRYDGKLLSNSYDIHRQYFSTIKKVIIDNKLKTDLTGTNLNDRFSINDNDLENTKIFIGYDKDGNSFWESYIKNKFPLRAFIVCSKYGEIIDSFNNPIKWSLASVSPNGDVFIIEISEKEANFYKITRRW
jgi:hypothetical protein